MKGAGPRTQVQDEQTSNGRMDEHRMDEQTDENPTRVQRRLVIAAAMAALALETLQHKQWPCYSSAMLHSDGGAYCSTTQRWWSLLQR